MRSVPLKRNTYVKLSNGVEKDNVAWEILKPLYGRSTAWGAWCETIRDFLANDCVRGVTSLDKSVFFRTQQGFGYGYGGEFRDPNLPNLDNGILKGEWKFRD